MEFVGEGPYVVWCAVIRLIHVQLNIPFLVLSLLQKRDPYVENDLGMNAFEICEKCGPFPEVRITLRKYQ